MSDIMECASSPCVNDGTCLDGVDLYTCICPAGNIGTQCDIGTFTAGCCDILLLKWYSINKRYKYDSYL